MSFELTNYQIVLQGKPLFSAINAEVRAGEILALKGASGSGKSTILADISGVMPKVFQSQGEIKLNNIDLRTQPVEARHVGILFQEDLLFPHMNVYDNLAFGLPSHVKRSEAAEKISTTLASAGLNNFEKRDITTLSGGQRSRISLLRTLLSEPSLILLDEPFSKLDTQLRDQFRAWVFEQLCEQNIPAVLVTHDDADIPDHSQAITLRTNHA